MIIQGLYLCCSFVVCNITNLCIGEHYCYLGATLCLEAMKIDKSNTCSATNHQI